jgi:hypothetical protein
MEEYVIWSKDKTLRCLHLKTNQSYSFELENSIELCKPVPSEFAPGSKNFLLIADCNEIALIQVGQDRITQLCSKELTKRMNLFNGGLRALSLQVGGQQSRLEIIIMNG